MSDIRRRPAVLSDLVEQASYIAVDNIRAADRFLDAVEATLEELAAMPGMGNPRDFGHPRLTGMRVWAVRGFRQHLIFYRPTSDGIEVIRVLHAARDLGAIMRAEAQEL